MKQLKNNHSNKQNRLQQKVEKVVAVTNLIMVINEWMNEFGTS